MKTTFKSKLTPKLAAVILTAATALSLSAQGANAAELYDESSVSASPRVESKSAGKLPSAYSSRDFGYVTPVKQQIYNDCWAYAGLSALESKLLRDGYQIEEMSQDHMNLWATTRQNSTGWQRNYFGSGFAAVPLGYLSSWQGGVYAGAAGTLDLNVSGDAARTDLAAYGVTSMRFLRKNEPDAIKRAITDCGGVYTSFSMANSCFNSSRTAYYLDESLIIRTTDSGINPDDTTVTDNEINLNEIPIIRTTGHAVEIVGWDDEFPKESFKNSHGLLPQSDGAWLAKNSWGANNSMKGFFWISYEDTYVFSDKYKSSFAIESVQPIDSNVSLLQNEIYGATYEFDYIKDDNLTFINRFKFEKNFKQIDKIIFKTEACGASYTLYYVPDKNGSPSPNRSDWNTLGGGTVDYSGYICADINDFTTNDSVGSVAVTIDCSALNKGIYKSHPSYTKSTIGVGEWLIDRDDDTLVFINDSRLGESYIYRNGKLDDLLNWYSAENSDELGGTFVIKAVMKRTSSAPKTGDVNLDGKIDINDATEIQKLLVNSVSLSKDSLSAADFNGDGKYSVFDVTALQKSLVSA